MLYHNQMRYSIFTAQIHNTGHYSFCKVIWPYSQMTQHWLGYNKKTKYELIHVHNSKTDMHLHVDMYNSNSTKAYQNIDC